MTEQIAPKVLLVGREVCALSGLFESAGFVPVLIPTNLGAHPETAVDTVKSCVATIFSGFGITNFPKALKGDPNIHLFAIRTDTLLRGQEPQAYLEGTFQVLFGLRGFLDPETAHLHLLGYLAMPLPV